MTARNLNDPVESLPGKENAVPLEMRENCERCRALLVWNSDAYICSHECTFCPECTAGLNAVCPNCGGELVRRPRRALEIA